MLNGEGQLQMARAQSRFVSWFTRALTIEFKLPSNSLMDYANKARTFLYRMYGT